MSASVSISLPAGPTTDPTSLLPTGSTDPPTETSSVQPPPFTSSTTTEQPPASTTSIPLETTTSLPETSTEQLTSTTDVPPTTTTEQTTTTTTTVESSTEPPSTTTPGVTVITVTPSDSAGDTTITVTTTSNNTDPSSTSTSLSSTASSSSTTSSTSSGTSLPSSGGGGLSQPAKIAIAIIIPIFAVVLIAFLGIFFWRRYRKRKDSEEMRRKEVEEYGYNPNNDASAAGTAVMGPSAMGTNGGEMAESDAGYRGWGSTAGGRKPSVPLSTGASNPTAAGYGNTSYADGGMGGMQYIPPQSNELYGSPVEAAAVAGGAAALGAAHHDEEPTQDRDRHSRSPLLSSPTHRPSTADSSTIGAAAINGPVELDDGLHRGDSVASSRYTNATDHSEGSDTNPHVGHPAGFTNTHPAPDGIDYYTDVANPYAGGDYDYHDHDPEQGYHQPPPMIQQVGARRNTRIENAPDNHYAQMPRQGNSGIAQNF